MIDSPNQQGQDDINLPKVLNYIANDLPDGTQIIVGTGLETDHAFDKKITLDRPYKLLREDEYEEISRVVEPLAKAMYDAIQRKDSASVL